MTEDSRKEETNKIVDRNRTNKQNRQIKTEREKEW